LLENIIACHNGHNSFIQNSHSALPRWGSRMKTWCIWKHGRSLTSAASI